ncbi:TolB family protein [Brevibacillus laterosporus]|uniref:TolB family protein n=1 Tax=Brevibacillus laterosporus TaxID=1465 RepID=UPI000E6C418A|nr:hypothetical protein [Brevibacillus laterosporus]AYB37038.1 hypothetical protein D5F52_01425 [Brevibacillus laterosporus]MBM7108784.1 Protein TolB [Brevibacillus laterosporus]
MRKKSFQRWIAVFAMATTLVSSVNPAFASNYDEEKILVNGDTAAAPYGMDFDGDYAVWVEESGKNYSIVIYDVDDESIKKKISSNSSKKVAPRIDRNTIVWAQQEKNGYELYAYDLKKDKERVLTNQDARVTDPEEIVFKDNVVVWKDKRDGGTNIYAIEVGSDKEYRISTGGKASHPSVYDDQVVWQDERNGRSELYQNQLGSSKENLTYWGKSKPTNPVISDDDIAFLNKSTGNIEKTQVESSKSKVLTHEKGTEELFDFNGRYLLYGSGSSLYYLDTNKDDLIKVNNDFNHKMPPVMSGRYVLYASGKTNNLTLKLFDTKKEKSKTLGKGENLKNVSSPAASKNYVAFVKEGKKESRVMLYDAKNRKTITISPEKHEAEHPVVSDSYVVYYDNDDKVLVAYDIETGESTKITTKKTDVVEGLYAIYKDHFVWVSGGKRSNTVNLTNLKKNKTSELHDSKGGIRSVAINNQAVALIDGDDDKYQDIVIYDYEDGGRIMKEEVENAKGIGLGDRYAAWSAYNSDTKDKDIFVYSFKMNRTDLLYEEEGDQENPIVSNNIIFYETEVEKGGDAVDKYVMYDMDRQRFRSPFVSEADPSEIAIGGNRLVWVDDRDDEGLYTSVLGSDDDDDDDDDED